MFSILQRINCLLIQMALNLTWTTVFFKLKMIRLALASIIAIIVFTVITYTYFIKVSKLAAYLLLPYLAWLCLASSLNLYIVLFN